MFPYVCLATMPLFCNVDWPRKIIAWFTGSSIYVSNYETYENNTNNLSTSIESSSNIEDTKKEKNKEILDEKETDSVSDRTALNAKIEKKKSHKEGGENWSESEEQKVSAWRHKIGEKKKLPRVTKKKKFVVSLLLLHVMLQFFLPYSHFITKVLVSLQNQFDPLKLSKVKRN